MNRTKNQTGDPAWRQKLFEIIFEADTPAGKLFDLLRNFVRKHWFNP